VRVREDMEGWLYLVDKENSGDQFSDTLIDVFVDDLVDFLSQFVCDFHLLGFHELTHHGHDILSSLRSRIGHI